MKFRDFQLPDRIKWIKEEKNYGKFICEPFERGYGHTVGNSLRRILLASMEGAVITSVKIEGVQHEYSTIKGVKEDTLEIIFLLKQLRFKIFSEESQTITLDVTGINKVTAKEFKLNESVQLLNPDAYVADIGENGSLFIEAVIERGRGYTPASDRQEKITSVGEIPLDAAFSPVKKVNYDVESARVGQTIGYDKLVMEIWTDGSVTPKDSVAYASQILKKLLYVFEIPEIEEIELGAEAAREKDEEEIKNMLIEDMKIGTRVINSLKTSAVNTLGELLECTEGDLLKLEKVGQKSVDDIKERLNQISEEKNIELKLKVE